MDASEIAVLSMSRMARVQHFDLGSSLIEVLPLESISVNGEWQGLVTHSQSIILHYFSMVQQSRAGMTKMVQVGKWIGRWTSP